MAKYPTWAAGQRITAALLNAMLPEVVVKSAVETVTSSTTLQDDNELFASVEASATYEVELQMFAMTANSDVTGDIKFGFTFPTGATLHFTGTGPNNADLSGALSSNSNGEWVARMSATSGVTDIPYGMSGIALGINLRALLIVSTTAGTLRLQWAQNTSDADTLSVLAGSFMKLRRVA